MDKAGGLVQTRAPWKLRTRIPVGKLTSHSCQPGQSGDRSYTAYLKKDMEFQYQELLTSETKSRKGTWRGPRSSRWERQPRPLRWAWRWPGRKELRTPRPAARPALRRGLSQRAQGCPRTPSLRGGSGCGGWQLCRRSQLSERGSLRPQKGCWWGGQAWACSQSLSAQASGVPGSVTGMEALNLKESPFLRLSPCRVTPVPSTDES